MGKDGKFDPGVYLPHRTVPAIEFDDDHESLKRLSFFAKEGITYGGHIDLNKDGEHHVRLVLLERGWE